MIRPLIRTASLPECYRRTLDDRARAIPLRSAAFSFAANDLPRQEKWMSVVDTRVPVSMVRYGSIHKATYRYVLGSVSVRYIAPDGAIRQMCKLTVGRRPDTIARMILDELVDAVSPSILAR